MLTLRHPSPRIFLAALSGFILALQAMRAFASREGEAFVQPVLWIVGIVLVTFTVLVIGGGLRAAFRASQSGESIFKAGARGLLKGLLFFVLVGFAAMAVLTILGMLWVAFSFLMVYVFIRPS